MSSDFGRSHGYAVAARLEQVSGGAVRLNMGMLYTGLMRLARRAAAINRRKP
jgi:DNA-binding PadR family transcriptional regulator